MQHVRSNTSGAAADALRKAPYVCARVVARRAPVISVFAIQLSRSSYRAEIERVQRSQSSAGEMLAATKQLPGASLGGLRIDMCCLLLMVQDQPQLGARIRGDHVDFVSLGQLDRLRDARMLIEVEHAPDLIGGPAASLSLIKHFCAARADRPFNKRHRCAPEIVDNENQVLAPWSPEVL